MRKNVTESRKWLLITAGLGSENFEASAKRVAHSARRFSILEHVVALNTEETFQLCSEVREKYPDQFKSEIRGFGFMAWKAEVVDKALRGHFGEVDGVVWVDGGCEIYASLWTEKKLRKQLKIAEKTGLYSFTLDTPEYKYTKKFLLDKYSDVPNILESPQIQTTWFALYGEIGRQISSAWISRTLEDFRNLDTSPSPQGENVGFIENRYDQSIFSLVCKKLGVIPASSFNVSGGNGFLSLVRALQYPIWATRNRTGQSIIPKFFTKVGQVSLLLKLSSRS